jgi:hypothetical protein
MALTASASGTNVNVMAIGNGNNGAAPIVANISADTWVSS